MNKFAALIASNKGRMVAAVTAFIMGGITQFITSKGLQLPGDLAVAISGMVAALTGWAIDSVGARINNQGVSAIQEALPGVTATGRANPTTVAAVERLVENAGMDKDMPERDLSADELLKIKTRLRVICVRHPELVPQLRHALAEVIDTKPAGR